MSSWQEFPPDVESGSELWWFYGTATIERKNSRGPVLKMIKVGSNTMIYQGSFVHIKAEGWEGVWTPVEMPNLPH